LEDRGRLPRPGRGRIDPPRLESREKCSDGLVVFLVVGAKIEPGSLPCPTRHGLEELGLQQSVLMMAFFGPGIREEHPDFLKSDQIGRAHV